MRSHGGGGGGAGRPDPSAPFPLLRSGLLLFAAREQTVRAVELAVLTCVLSSRTLEAGEQACLRLAYQAMHGSSALGGGAAVNVRAQVRTLPGALFPSGCNFGGADHERMFAAHAACLPDEAAKRSFFEQHGLWFLAGSPPPLPTNSSARVTLRQHLASLTLSGHL
jgi:hypothetical protein